MQKYPIIIAVCGKGGVGKTSISALLVRMLSQNPSHTVLAIDADPAVGLSFPLGINVAKTVDDIRNDLIERLERKESASREELIRSLDYELFSALSEKENLAFLAIGRPEGDGCYCQVNTLLKEIIKDIASRFDYVVIDAEAGVEQISRRVMEMVTHLLLVSDASLKGRHVAETINNVAQNKCRIQKAGLIYNRIQDMSEYESIRAATGLVTCGAILESNLIRSFDREGRSFFELEKCDAIDELNQAIQAFLNIQESN